MLGGLTWIAYTLAALLRPWGRDGANLIVSKTAGGTAGDASAFLVTALAGGLALGLLGLALAGVARRWRLPARLPGQIGLALGLASAALGPLLWFAALLAQPALAVAGMNAGSLMLAVAALLVAIDAAGQPLATPLFIVGALGLAAICALALLSLAGWMLPVYAALVMAIYGFAWVRFGAMLGSDR